MEHDGFACFQRWESIRTGMLLKLDAFRGLHGPVEPGNWLNLRGWLSSLTPGERKAFAVLPGGTVDSGQGRLVTGETILDDVCGELVGALEEAAGAEDADAVLAILDVTEGFVILSEHCNRRFSLETHWFELVLALLARGEAEVVVSAADLLQAVVSSSPSSNRLFESLGGLGIVSAQVKAPHKRRDVRHKLLQLLHFYLLPEPEPTEGDDRREVSEKVALLSAHLDDRIVAGLQNAFDLSMASGSERTGRSSAEEDESDEVQGLGKLAADTLMRSPRRRSKGGAGAASAEM